MFVWKRNQKNVYDIKIPIGMDFIHENEVNKIAGFYFLHNILNCSKRTKILNRHYSPILHGCMNTQKGRDKCNNF